MRILTCKTCESRKIETDFYRQASVLGRRLSCKECVKERARNYRSDNLASIQEYDRERGRLPHRKADKKARAHKYANDGRTKKYRNSNPEKWAAHIALNNALRKGTVERKDRCERCNGRYAVQGHHEDYSRKLDVIWLCIPCHGERHREINAERRAAQMHAAE